MMKRWLCLTLILVLCLGALPAAPASAAPTVAISKSSATINLSRGNTLQLSAKVSSSKYEDQLLWKSGNTAIATVSQNGLVTAKKAGNVKIGVRIQGETGWSLCKLTVKAGGVKPTSIVLSQNTAQLLVGETLSLDATVKPATASQSVTWKSSKPAIASVSADGTVTAKKPGKVLIRATSAANTKIKKSMQITVAAAVAPTKITLSPSSDSLEVGDKLTLSLSVRPEGASEKVKWTSTNSAVASVSSSGVVTAKKAGTATIRATSSVKSTVRGTATITVTDPNAVTSITISDGDFYLDKGSSKTLTTVLKPANSSAAISWKSDNLSVASVTTSGKVTGLGSGTATITATAGGKSDSIQVKVLTDERETTLPESYLTSSSKITANSKKIDAIYQSAMEELETCLAKGQISASERALRKEMIQRGFVMYDVAWTPSANVRYWSGSTSYVEGRIYIGMPYTQYSRTYNLEKWLKNVTYQKSSGCYQVSMPSTNYPGNDCSSFVSICQFGMNTAYSYLNTTAMYSSTQYKTVTDGFANLMPGDVLVKKGHTALFLYYVTSDRIMVLEQGGGSEPNTVACHIKSISGTYRPQGYRVRRKASLPSA